MRPSPSYQQRIKFEALRLQVEGLGVQELCGAEGVHGPGTWGFRVGGLGVQEMAV